MVRGYTCIVGTQALYVHTHDQRGCKAGYKIINVYKKRKT